MTKHIYMKSKIQVVNRRKKSDEKSPSRSAKKRAQLATREQGRDSQVPKGSRSSSRLAMPILPCCSSLLQNPRLSRLAMENATRDEASALVLRKSHFTYQNILIVLILELIPLLFISSPTFHFGLSLISLPFFLGFGIDSLVLYDHLLHKAFIIYPSISGPIIN